MKIPFRQGIISYHKSGQTPLFLMPSATQGFVDFNVSPAPTLVSFAHGSSNYLQSFDRDVDAAWGPVRNGDYLYWEIDLLTAQILYRTTLLAPVYSLEPPTSPSPDQHWFDLSNFKMKSWNGSKWVVKVALFAGHVPTSGLSNLEVYGRGSQAGLAEEVDAGYIMLDTLQRPIRGIDFEFLTTATPVRIRTTSSTSGVLAVPPNAFVPIRASETIPPFSLVHFTGPDTVGLASSDPALSVQQVPIGVVQAAMQANDIGVVTQSGEITWDQWDWSQNIGAPLYCGFSGEITAIRPNTLLAYRVGFVKNRTTVLFQVDAETQPQVYFANANDLIINAQAPLTTSFTTTNLGERVWTVIAPTASTTTSGLMPVSAVTDIANLQQNVNLLGIEVSQRALITHTQPISTVVGLQDQLDARSLVGHNHDLLYLPLGYTGFDIRYAPLLHNHTISEVLGLQNVLNTKTDASYIWPQSSISGLADSLAVKTDIGHTHVIADVSGLSVALASKAQLSHTHVIAEVVGLQPALDDLANRKPAPLTIVNHTGPLVFGDKSQHNTSYRKTDSTDVVITIQADQFFGANAMPPGGNAIVGKHGPGKLTFAAAPGVVLNYPDSLVITRLHAKVTLIKVGNNEWDLEGHFDPATV